MVRLTAYQRATIVVAVGVLVFVTSLATFSVAIAGLVLGAAIVVYGLLFIGVENQNQKQKQRIVGSLD